MPWLNDQINYEVATAPERALEAMTEDVPEPDFMAAPVDAAPDRQRMPSWPTWVTRRDSSFTSSSAIPDRFRSTSSPHPGDSAVPGEFRSSSQPKVGR